MARKEFETLTVQMFYILLVLYHPLCGLEIMDEVDKITKGEIKIGAGTLYALLPRFEKEKYIQLVNEENKRKTYQITQIGKDRLEEERSKLVRQIQLMD